MVNGQILNVTGKLLLFLDEHIIKLVTQAQKFEKLAIDDLHVLLRVERRETVGKLLLNLKVKPKYTSYKVSLTRSLFPALVRSSGSMILTLDIS